MTLHLPPDAPDGYAVTYDRLRIFQGDPSDPDGRPWNVDGYDSTSHRYTEACASYATHAEAVAMLPAFVRDVSGWRAGPAEDYDPDGSYGPPRSHPAWGLV